MHSYTTCSGPPSITSRLLQASCNSAHTVAVVAAATTWNNLRRSLLRKTIPLVRRCHHHCCHHHCWCQLLPLDRHHVPLAAALCQLQLHRLACLLHRRHCCSHHTLATAALDLRWTAADAAVSAAAAYHPAPAPGRPAADRFLHWAVLAAVGARLLVLSSVEAAVQRV